MKWGTLKAAVRDLGFEDDSVFEEYASIILNATNRAIKLINLNVQPKTAVYEIELNGTGGYERYDLSLIDGYVEMYGTPTIETQSGVEDFSDYRVEQDNVLVINQAIEGTVRVFYAKAPTIVTSETPDEEILDVPNTVDVLLPLLTSYYVWLDDDVDKAKMYYQQYESLKAEIQSKINTSGSNAVRATVYGGIKWQ